MRRAGAAGAHSKGAYARQVNRGVRLRAVAAYALVAIAALLAPVAILGTWTQRHVVSTQGYVDTVASLSSDARVQQAVANAVTDAVLASVPTDELLASLPRAVAGTGQVTADAARRLVRSTVTEVVESSAFRALWVSANRSAQTQVLAELRGADGTGGGHLVIELDQVGEAVRQQLVASGFTALRNVRFDTGRQQVVLVPAAELGAAHRWWPVFESSTRWLAPVVVLLAAAALALAPRRRRVLLAEALALLTSVGVAALLTALGHGWYVDRLNGLVAANAARAVGDVLFGSIAHWLRALAVVAGAVAVAALATLLIPSRQPAP
jgi:hypothetical protein